MRDAAPSSSAERQRRYRARRLGAVMSPPHPPLTDAERQRKRRERERTGARKAIANIPLRIIRALVLRGLIAEADVDDPYQLGDAICRLADPTPDEKTCHERDHFLALPGDPGTDEGYIEGATITNLGGSADDET